jgi:uncharacterized protein with von Willebrand factor type A (vWA) domain
LKDLKYNCMKNLEFDNLQKMHVTSLMKACKAEITIQYYEMFYFSNCIGDTQFVSDGVCRQSSQLSSETWLPKKSVT